MPKVSIIVPVYKVEPYLKRCVDSILNQTYIDYELILIDDGSPDSCGKICDEYALQDSRVCVIHQENRGLSAARNAGIDISTGEYVTFVDSDDYIHPQYCEILYNNAVYCNAETSICGFINVDKTISMECIITNSVPLVYTGDEAVGVIYGDDWELGVRFIISCAKLYRKNLFNTTRFPVGRIHEDEFTTYKLLYHSNKVVMSEYNLYYYYRNPSSITNNDFKKKNLDFLDALKESIDFFDNKQEDLYTKAVIRCLYNMKKYYGFVVNKLNDKETALNIKEELLSIFYLNKKRCSLYIYPYVDLYRFIYPITFKTRWINYLIKSALGSKLRRYCKQ